MKVLLLCALLIASVYADASYDQAVELLQRHLQNVPPVLESVQEVYATAHVHVRSVQERAPSGSCLIALGQALNGGCFPNATDASFNPATAPVCTSACDSAFNQIFTDCAGEFDTAQVSGFTFWRSVLCSKVGNDFCYPVLQNLPSQGATLTKDNLDAVCSPCFAKFLNLVATYSGAAAAASFADENTFFFFDLVCTKSPSGEYCALDFQANGGSPLPSCANTQFSEFSFTAQCLDGLCEDGCTRRLLTKMYLRYGNTEMGLYFKVLRLFMCSKNPDNDKYCLLAWTEATSQGAPADCTATRNLAGSLGCCLGSFYQLLKALSNDTAALIDQAAGACSVVVPIPCVKPPSGSLVGKIVVSIKYSWASSNLAALKDALKADLASFLGVSPDDVDITGVADFGAKRAAGTSISFSASADDSSSTQALVNQFNSQGTNIVFSQTSSLYGASNPGQAVEVQSVQAEYSSASTIAVSMFALVAALLVLLF